MKVGIGITTFNRPDCLKQCVSQINKHSSGYDTKLYIAVDSDEDRRGVAFRKNECLIALKDCEYVFLFDDDCFPIKDKWIEFFVYSKEEHVLFLNKKKHRFILKISGKEYYNDCGGVFMFLTKNAIEKVGLFDEKYTIYGFEHADFSNRIYGENNRYRMIEGTSEYLFAHDYSTVNHKSSISDEEKNKYVKLNWNKYFNENTI